MEGGDSRTEIRELRRRVEDAEKEVNELEQRILELTRLLEDPELYTTRDGTEKALAAGKQLDETRRSLDAAIEKWTAATERSERLPAT